MMDIAINNSGELEISSDMITNEEYWNLKLAFKNRSSPKGIPISFGDSVSAGVDEEKWVFPDGIKESELCYLIRAATDNLLLKNGTVPFHASAVSAGNRQIFLFSPSHGGKSYISVRLTSEISGSFIIGDDHVCVSPVKVYGNRLLRTHAPDQAKPFLIKNRGSDAVKKRLAVLYTYSDHISYFGEITDKHTIFSRLKQLSAMKYAVSDLSISGKHFIPKQVFMSDPEKDYEKVISEGFFEKVTEITGTFDHAVHCINKLLI